MVWTREQPWKTKSSRCPTYCIILRKYFTSYTMNIKLYIAKRNQFLTLIMECYFHLQNTFWELCINVIPSWGASYLKINSSINKLLSGYEQEAQEGLRAHYWVISLMDIQRHIKNTKPGSHYLNKGRGGGWCTFWWPQMGLLLTPGSHFV